MSFAIKGVPDADNLLMSLRPTEVLSWLREGFAHLESDDVQKRRDAFPPLELAPDRDLLAQLATALREAEQHRLKCTKRVRSILRERLKMPTVWMRETAECLIDFWRLLGGINCPADIFADARGFLKELLHHQASSAALGEDELRSLVDAVVACVLASKPASSAQVSFMRFLRSERQLWSDRFVDSFIDCAFSELDGRRISSDVIDDRRMETWCNTREALGADLELRADPTSPTGRALIRSVARYLGVPASHATSVEEVIVLRDKVWGMECPTGYPTDDFSRKETLGELLDEWA
ncbi:hypothetical protein [Sphingomonas sp. PSPC2-2]|jgi:hypothetical protein|uniref:hypothetical protein n=1 Tax=Sphingomonas sp. PSPC2-2 TaxID=2804576 RepID=UPI003CE7AA6E